MRPYIFCSSPTLPIPTYVYSFYLILSPLDGFSFIARTFEWITIVLRFVGIHLLAMTFRRMRKNKARSIARLPTIVWAWKHEKTSADCIQSLDRSFSILFLWWLMGDTSKSCVSRFLVVGIMAYVWWRILFQFSWRRTLAEIIRNKCAQ